MADYTLSALRARIARLLGDHISGTATSGSTTTLVDTAELGNYAGTTAGMGDTLYGRYVYINGGTNAGQERRISSNTQSTSTITVPTWSAPSTDSTYEIHGEWRVADYNAAINQAISDLRGDNGALIAQVADVSITMDDAETAASYYYDLPVALRSIKSIVPEGPTSGIYDEHPLSYNVDYTLEKKTAATSSSASIAYLVLTRYSSIVPLDGRKLRIIGSGYQAEVTTDSGLIAEHLVPFIQHQAAYYLLSSRSGLGTPDSQANQRIAQQRLALAEAARSRLEYRASPGEVPIPV